MTIHPTILLVDGEDMLRDATAMMLSRRGGRVRSAATLDEAVELAAGGRYDVAVLDESSASPRATEVLRRMRLLGCLPRRIIVCSGEAMSPADAEQFSSVIPKPFAFELLVRAVFGAPVRLRAQSGLFPRIRNTMRRGNAGTRGVTVRTPRRAAQGRRGHG